jgi:hypothetical protein
MVEAQQSAGTLSKRLPDTKQPVLSIADELSKLAKLREQGIISTDEFSKMKNNLRHKIWKASEDRRRFLKTL